MHLLRLKNVLPIAILATTMACGEAGKNEKQAKPDILAANIDSTIKAEDDLAEFNVEARIEVAKDAINMVVG